MIYTKIHFKEAQQVPNNEIAKVQALHIDRVLSRLHISLDDLLRKNVLIAHRLLQSIADEKKRQNHNQIKNTSIFIQTTIQMNQKAIEMLNNRKGISTVREKGRRSSKRLSRNQPILN